MQKVTLYTITETASSIAVTPIYTNLLEAGEKVAIPKQADISSAKVIIMRNAMEFFIIKSLSFEDGVLEFAILNNITGHFFKENFIALATNAEGIVYDDASSTKYLDEARKFNASQQESIKEKLDKLSYNRDISDNQDILVYLAAINSKLDEVLSLLRPEKKEEGALTFSILFLNAQEAFLAAPKSMEVKSGANIFLKLQVGIEGDYMKLAACGKVALWSKLEHFNIFRFSISSMTNAIEDRLISFMRKVESASIRQFSSNNK